ncbi:tripartite motif-containing protein 2-like isoform X2 [Branchiostoma lanceolatum]|uniref:tripartite motif-containing protein 2-like isoform X2 n=1 Tax=Branchiostoma lanceolatum TaxID=7740 RepID=UPI003456D949
MAQLPLTDLKRHFLTCPICLDTFCSPKILPCVHTFCAPCLIKHTNGRTRFPCPECRQDTPMPSNGISGLQDNHYVTSLYEWVSSADDRMEYLPHTTNDDSLGKCNRHTDATLSYYCLECEAEVCECCIREQHFSHRENITVVENRGKFDAVLLDSFKETVNKLSSLLSMLEQEEKRECEQRKVLAREIESAGRKLVEQINLEVYQQIQQLQALHQGTLLDIVKEKETVANYLMNMEQWKQQAEVLLKRPTEVDEVEQVQTKMRSLLQDAAKCEGLGTNRGSTKYTFVREELDHRCISIGKIVEYCNVSEENANQQSACSMVRFGREGSGEGEFRYPSGVAISDEGAIFVLDADNSRVQVFDSDGKFLRTFTVLCPEINSNNTRLEGIAMALDGNLFLTDKTHKSVMIVNQHGELQDMRRLEMAAHPAGIAFDPRTWNLLVSDVSNHCVIVMNSMGGLRHTFGSPGALDRQFNQPLYLTVNARGEIIVSDFFNHSVKVFDAEGVFLFKFGGSGSDDGQLSLPAGVCTDASGNIVVADRGNSRVSLFDARGHFVKHVATKQEGLRAPVAVAVSKKGALVVTDGATSSLTIVKNFMCR